MSPLCTSEAFVKGVGSEGTAFPIRCKRWSCPTCAQINRARVIAIAREAKPRALLTLTVSSKDYPDPQVAAKVLKKGLTLLRLRLKRHPRLQNFQFLAVFEKHISGHPHLHLLIKGSFLPWQELRRMWEEITGSYMVDIRKINSEGLAALYVAKYIGKDLAAFDGCKRWWRSHGYSEGNTTEYVADQRYSNGARYYLDIHTFRFLLKWEGFVVEKEGREGIRWRAPPDSDFDLRYLLASAQGRSAPLMAGRGRRV